MKKIILLWFAFTIFVAFNCKAKTIIIVNSSYTFSPDDVTINVGDTVNFSLASIHDVVEVSKDVYDAKGNTSNGGFKLNYGGGIIAFKNAGVFYYVCEPHASMGMRGIIRVTDGTVTNVDNSQLLMSDIIKVYPNPVSDFLNVELNLKNAEFANVRILNLNGQQVKLFKNIFFQQGKSSQKLILDKNLKQGSYVLEVNCPQGCYRQILIMH
jgi:plastocyanin